MKSTKGDYFSFERKWKSLTPCLKVLKQHIQLLRQKKKKAKNITYKFCNSSFGIKSHSTNSHTLIDNILVYIWIYICQHSPLGRRCSRSRGDEVHRNRQHLMAVLGSRGHGRAESWPSIHRYCIWWNSNLRERNTFCAHQFKMGKLSNFQQLPHFNFCLIVNENM